MPNVMCWNIQNFSGGKMNTADVQRVILTTIYPALPAPPLPPAPPGPRRCDMFVIVEVMGRNTALGGVPTNAGAAGMTLLLASLQAIDGNWRCAPPISTATGGGRAEAIGVFYMNNVFTFTGPHVWSNFGPMPAAQIGATVAPWNVGTFAGAGAPSPQIYFLNPLGTAFLDFPIPGCRRPLRCQFTYNGGGNTLDLWVLHNPPQLTSARNATFALAAAPDITAAVPANTLRLVCGDFNLNTSNPWQYGGYAGMIVMGFSPAIGGAPASFLPLGTNTHFAGKPTAATYRLNGLSLDNMLTRGPAPPLAPLAPVAFFVVDRVAGIPAPNWNTAMLQTLPAILLMPQPAQSQAFRSWANFGKVGNRPSAGNMQGRRGASDHMPMVISF